MKNIPSHDLASLMDDDNIAVRAGHNCTMPLIKKLGVPGVSRISFYFYNTLEDIDEFVDVLEKIKEKFD